jgi:hypothetical protein
MGRKLPLDVRVCDATPPAAAVPGSAVQAAVDAAVVAAQERAMLLEYSSVLRKIASLVQKKMPPAVSALPVERRPAASASTGSVSTPQAPPQVQVGSIRSRG